VKGKCRVIQAAAELGGEAMQAHTFTEAEPKVKSKIAPQTGPKAVAGRRWCAAQADFGG